MSKTIDERVVEMQFDNRQFERNVSTTMSTLEKLKRSLRFDGASKGLENVEAASKKVDMSVLGNAVETVRTRFSALEVMGVTALANITNSAVNAGKRIVSALTIDPIKTGFQEYETQINAVQTILANTQNKGSTLQDVNAALDELNKYADQTIYNFTEMTKNIGTFTAAGVELDKSVTSIKGIANLAAVSGSTAQQASTAMYQLSQALATGKVSLMDWNSVVNAGMGGQVFQDALKRTATNFGVNVDAMIKKYGSFRESLTEGGWLTAEVLTETLTQLSGAYTKADLIAQGYSEEQAQEIVELANTAVDAATKVKTFTQLFDTLKEAAQSGWTQTWELIIGDFEESKEFLTQLSDIFGGIINSMSDARNSLLEGALNSNWEKMTGDIMEAGISVDDFTSKITEIGRAELGEERFDKLVEEAGSLDKAFQSGALSSDLLRKAIDKTVPSSKELDKQMSDLRGNLKSNEDILKALTDAGFENSEMSNVLAKSSKGMKVELSDLSDAQLEAIGYTEKEISTIRQLSKQYDILNGSLGTFIDGIKDKGGRQLLVDTLLEGLDHLIKVFSTVGKAWEKVFPPMTSERLYEIITLFKEFVSSLKPSEDTLSKLERTFTGLFSVLSIGKRMFTAVLSAISPLFSGFGSLASGVLDVTASFGDWLYNLDQTIAKTGIFNDVLQGIVGVIQTVIGWVKDLGAAFAEVFLLPGLDALSSVFDGFGDAANKMSSGMSGALDSMSTALEQSSFMSLLKALWGGVKAVGSGIASVFATLASSLANAIGNFDFGSFLEVINSVISGGIGIAVIKFIMGLSDAFENVTDILGGATNVLYEVGGCFEAYQNTLNAGALLKISIAIGVLVASILVLSTIDADKLGTAVAAIMLLLMGLTSSMSKLGLSVGGVVKTIPTLIAFSLSILILASALKKLGDLDFKQLSIGLLGVAGLMAEMVIVTKIMGKGGKTIIKGAAQMLIFAAAITILASACKELSTLNWDQLARGLTGVGVLLSEVAIFLRIAKFGGKAITTATGIVILASSMLILSEAAKRFAEMSWEEIGKGLASIGSLLVAVMAFTRLTGNAKHVISTGVALIAIGGAMKIFASATKDFATMQWGETGRGLAAMAGALAAITLALNFMPKNVILIGTGLVIVGAALEIMADVLTKLGRMEWESIGKGLAALGGSLAILSVGLIAMKGSLAGSAALLVAATSLAILTPILMGLGSMSWESIAKGLVAIAGAFAVIGIAGALLGPVIPAILGLAGSMALIAVAAIGIGASLVLVGTGLAAIAAGITALGVAVAAGVGGIVMGITEIIIGIARLIPEVAKALGEAIIVFAGVIAKGAPALGEAIKSVTLTIIDVLIECIPALTNGFFQLLIGVLDGINQYAPQIIDSLFDFIIALINGVANRMPELIQAGINLLMSFFSGVVDALGTIDTSTLIQGIAGVGLLSAIMLALSAMAALVPGAMLGVLGMAAVVAEIAILLAAIGALAQIPGLQWLIGEGGNLLQGIGTAIGKFIGGLVGGVMGGITAQLPQMGLDLSRFMANIQPFIIGAKMIDSSVLDGVKTIAETVLLLTGANLLDSLTSWLTGGSSLADFAAELVPFGNAMAAFSRAMAGKVDPNLIVAASTAGKALAEMAATLPNSGGLLGFFAGENDMDAFADQLIPFGEAMTGFSNAVVDLKADAVEKAAIAGKSVVELASSLPNSGGLWGFLAGNNDMAAFGEQLVPFGEAMTDFSLAVVDLKPESIEKASIAGKALVELANTIPNTGGLITFFTGSNDMATFGAQLVIFGDKFKQYSDYMVDVDSGVVTATANAASSIVELQKSLPKEGGWFSDDATLADFGYDMASFGEKFASFYGKISGINVSILSAVITQTNRLIQMAKGMSGIDTKSVSSFSVALTNLGNAGIESFISAFTNAGPRVSQAATTMLTTFTTAANAQKGSMTTTFTSIVDGIIIAIQGKTASFAIAGQSIMTQFILGINLKKPEVQSSFSLLITSVLTTIQNKYGEFETVGTMLIVKLIGGIKSKEESLKTSFTTSLSSALTSIRGQYSSFYDAGRYLVEGFTAGINDNVSLAASAAASMAHSAYTSAMNALNAASPSKLFMKVGSYVPLGFAIGISSEKSAIEKSTDSMAQTALDSTKNAIAKVADAINSDVDTQPTIRPVLDLTDVETKAGRLNTLFSRNRALSIESSMKRPSTPENQNGAQTGSSGSVFSFTQNNYSPKALSRVEIYRQTKNQFSQMERMVKA